MSAFDQLAPTYDTDFTATPIAQYLRNRVHGHLLRNFQPGMHVLELGCGTGEDALFLAQQGIRVTATDYSQEMLTVAREKTASCENVSLFPLDLSAPRVVEPGVQYDGVFSNFGALNCLSDWQPLAQWLANIIKLGGIAAFGIMAPYCAWEFAWHALHWKWEIALRRLRGSEFDGIPIAYPMVKQLSADFSPHFEQISVKPLGVFLPPTALFGVVEKRPKLMQRLIAWEDRVQDASWLAQFADHYWIELQRL